METDQFFPGAGLGHNVTKGMSEFQVGKLLCALVLEGAAPLSAVSNPQSNG